MTPTSFDTHAESLRVHIEQYLATSVPPGLPSLYDPVRDMLTAGGKRVRPLLTALAAGPDAPSDHWLPAACAVELLHTFTLVHDDIMDNAASRRGRPTTHVAYGVNTAILSGDVIIALATESLARTTSPTVHFMLEEFGLAFRRVCEGQALDKEFELRDDLTVEEYLHMIDLKTSKVLELAAVLGALAVESSHKEDLRAFAHHLGLAFQISDDLLDLTADQAAFGKTIGGDIVEGKRTLLFVCATEHYSRMNVQQRALMDRIRDHAATAEDVPLARELFSTLGVLTSAERIAKQETDRAKAALGRVPVSEARQHLEVFCDRLLGRSS